jgi:hypothetical protein
MKPFSDLAYPHRLGQTPAERRLARRRREAVLWMAAAVALFLGLGGGDGYVTDRWVEARIEVLR